jgi:hypothetical protein
MFPDFGPTAMASGGLRRLMVRAAPPALLALLDLIHLDRACCGVCELALYAKVEKSRRLRNTIVIRDQNMTAFVS